VGEGGCVEGFKIKTPELFIYPLTLTLSPRGERGLKAGGI
jgi:hypothetical protein